MNEQKYPIAVEEKGLPVCPHCNRPPHRLQFMPVGSYTIGCFRDDCPNPEDDTLATGFHDKIFDVRLEWRSHIDSYETKKFYNWHKKPEAK